MRLYTQFNKKRNCDEYFLDFTHAGTRYRDRLGSLEDFKAACLEKHSPASPSVLSAVEQYLAHVVAIGKACATRDAVNLKQWMATLKTKTKLSDISEITLASYRTKRLKDVTARTFNDDLKAFKRFFKFAVKRGLCQNNPTTDIGFVEGKPPRDVTLTGEQEERLLSKCDAKLRLIVQAALLSGLRKGELIALEWPDLDFEELTLKVRKSKTPAGVRTIPLNDDLASLLRPLAASTGRVFPSGLGEKPTDISTGVFRRQ